MIRPTSALGIRVGAACALACAAGIVGAPRATSAQVYLRGQETPLSAEVLNADVAGVFVSEGSAAGGAAAAADAKPKATKIVSWDRVREVKGTHGTEAARYAAMAEDLWRARTRIERGDFAAAEPLLEKTARGLQNQPLVGPSAAVLEEGLLRCRLHRGAQASAVFAFLRWRAVADSAQTTGTRASWMGGTFDAPPVIDTQLSLSPALPPVFLDDAAVQAMATSTDWERIGGATELANLYRAAARYETGQDPELGAGAGVVGGRSSEDVRLVADIVLARAGNDEQRAAARTSLISRLSVAEIEPWVEAWCRVGLGRSLIRESSVEDQRRGVLHLLHVPARLSRSSPYLASVALAEAAREIKKMGDAPGAASLKSELVQRYPRRSAASWAPLGEIRVQPAEAPEGESGSGG